MDASYAKFESEKAIEDYVFEKILSEHACPVSNEPVDLVYRQFIIDNYGICDLIKIKVSDTGVVVTILELKNEPFRISHLLQVARYRAGLAHAFYPYYKAGFRISIFCQLAGPYLIDNFPPEEVCLLSQFTNNNIEIFDLSLSFESGFLSRNIKESYWKTCSPPKMKKQVRAVFSEFKAFESFKKNLENNILKTSG